MKDIHSDWGSQWRSHKEWRTSTVQGRDTWALFGQKGKAGGPGSWDRMGKDIQVSSVCPVSEKSLSVTEGKGKGTVRYMTKQMGGI